MGLFLKTPVKTISYYFKWTVGLFISIKTFKCSVLGDHGTRVSQNKKVDTFILRNLARTWSIFGEARLRSRSAFCDYCGWAVSATQPQPSHHCSDLLPSTYPLSHIPFSHQGFTRLLFELNNKQKTHSIFKDLMVVLTKFVNWQPVRMDCLNTPGLFSLGGELTLIFFFFSSKKSPQNWTASSSLREQKCSPHLGPPSRIFAMKNFNEIGQWRQTQSQNRRTCLEVDVVFPLKSPIRARPSRHIHFLEMFKANLSKSGNKHKNSTRVDTFIFVWETLFPKNDHSVLFLPFVSY